VQLAPLLLPQPLLRLLPQCSAAALAAAAAARLHVHASEAVEALLQASARFGMSKAGPAALRDWQLLLLLLLVLLLVPLVTSGWQWMPCSAAAACAQASRFACSMGSDCIMLGLGSGFEDRTALRIEWH
jgi:membrane-anchored protein YejM (alkaline phosphatase superfamily)